MAGKTTLASDLRAFLEAKADGDALGRSLRGSNLEVQTADDPELVVAGPAGTGKSVGLLYLLHRTAEAYPKSRQLILRKTRASLTQSGLDTFEDDILPTGHPVLFNRDGSRILKRNRSSYDYPSGATIIVGGMDEAERLFSSKYDRIYWQEVTEGQEEEWVSLRRALRNFQVPVQQLVGDCNPKAPSHWVRARAKAGHLRMLDTTHKDNPAYWDGQEWTPKGRAYMDNLAGMTGIMRDRLYLGLWVAAEGAIYAPYFRTGGLVPNLVPRFRPPETWRVLLSIDFGFSHPLAAGVWVVDDDGRMTLEHELHMSGRTLDQHAPDIRAMLRGRQYEGVADSAQPESIERLRSLGIVCQPAVKGPDSVKAGIRQCIARMADPGDGRPRLTVMEGALVERDEARAAKHLPLCLTDELELYRWKVDVSGQSLEEPVKENDDACDQMRYGVMWLDGQEDDAGGSAVSCLPRATRVRRVC